MPRLEWDGKKAVENYHLQVPYHVLREETELSAGGDAGAGNLLVQGDNLAALKALLPYYRGQVKCIYIDPPYNTGNEGWVYNDNVSSPVIKAWLGKAVGKEAEDFSRHDKWLCMMYPRLKLLWEFLREDGSIWISIDDNEVASLRLLADEIFQSENFVAANVWQKRYSRENREAIGDVHEYLVVYAKNPEFFKGARNRVQLDEAQAKVYKNGNNDPKGRWRGIPMTAQGYRPNQMYAITTPAGVTHHPPEGRCWSTIESEYLKLRAAGRIYFGKNQKAQPSVIRYLSEVDGFVPWTWWPHEEVGHTDEAKKEIQTIFGTQTAFDTPKPVRLIERVLQIATNPGDTVLDSFAGSGTTGHAVLQLNKAASAGRRVILVEMEPAIARDVTAKRMRRVSEGYKKADGSDVPGLGGGFRFLTLGEPIFNADGTINSAITFPQLARHVWFEETREPLPADAVLDSPFLGVSRTGLGVYLLFNGVLKDLRVNGGNILTPRLLAKLPPHGGPKVIYAAGCRLDAARLREEGITFKQTPYQITGAAASADALAERTENSAP